MKHFLVDYENRNEYGLAGIRGLTENDHVYILFSQNACKLDLNVISETVANIHAVKVQPGRQSLDMHLVSCLGFLLNEYGTENEYFVISDDTDFDKVIEFWKGRGYSVTRVKSVESALSPEAAEAAAAIEAATVTAAGRKKRTSTRRTSTRGKKTAAKEEAAPVKEEAEAIIASTDTSEVKAEDLPFVEAPSAEVTVTSTPTAETIAVETTPAPLNEETSPLPAPEEPIAENPEAEPAVTTEEPAASAEPKQRRRKTAVKAKVKSEEGAAQKNSPRNKSLRFSPKALQSTAASRSSLPRIK